MHILDICCSALSAGEGGGSANAMLAKHTTQKYSSIVNLK